MGIEPHYVDINAIIQGALIDAILFVAAIVVGALIGMFVGSRFGERPFFRMSGMRFGMIALAFAAIGIASQVLLHATAMTASSLLLTAVATFFIGFHVGRR